MDTALAHSRSRLAEAVADARDRTFDLVADLTDEQLLGPRLAIVNPLIWEIGHLAWFQEWWALRGGGRAASVRADADRLYDSMKVAHDTRWTLPLPSRADTLAYLASVRDRLIAQLTDREPAREEVYFALLSVFHE